MGILVLAALVASFIFKSQLPGMATTKDMDYSTFYTKLTAGEVKTVTTTDSTATVELKNDKITYNVTMPARWLDDSTLTAALHKASEPKMENQV